jgi:hypothetical protein
VGYDLLTGVSGGDGGGASDTGGSLGAGGVNGGGQSTERDAAVGGTAGDASVDATTDVVEIPDGRAGGSGGTAPRDAASSPDAANAGDADVCAAPALPPDYCTTIPRLHGPPVIDGALDCGVTLRAFDPLGWNGPTAIPSGQSASYAIAYRADGLYFFLTFTDSTRVPAQAGDEVWRGDGVEMYVDADGVFSAPPAFDNPGTRQIQVAAPADDMTNQTRAELFTWGFDGTRVPWTAPRFVSKPTPTGYVIEAFVTAEELAIPAWSLAAGMTVGTNLGVNVSDPDTSTYQAPDGYRLGQYFVHLADNGNPPFADVAAFCLPTLAP